MNNLPSPLLTSDRTFDVPSKRVNVLLLKYIINWARICDHRETTGRTLFILYLYSNV